MPGISWGFQLFNSVNFLFDWQYAINYNLTKSLNFRFTASNYNIVRNYFGEDENGETFIRQDVGIYDDFFNTGEANRHTQQLEVNYELPFNKIPFLSFLNASYRYTGDFDWQRGGDALNEIAGENLNTIQNANTHTLNASLTMDKFYKYIGLTKRTAADARRANSVLGRNNTATGTDPGQQKAFKKTSKLFNTVVDVLTSVKTHQHQLFRK